MAIEIKELIIRAVVDYRLSEKEGTAASVQQPAHSERDLSEIIDVCVKQVLKIIKQKQKR